MSGVHGCGSSGASQPDDLLIEILDVLFVGLKLLLPFEILHLKSSTKRPVLLDALGSELSFHICNLYFIC